MCKGCRFWTLLIAILSLAAEDAIKGWQGPDQSLYVVTDNHYAEGYTPSGPTIRFGDLIMIEIYNPDIKAPEHGANYDMGKSYNLFSGGERRGTVKVEKVAQLQCDSSAALITASPPIDPSSKMMALATNASGIRSHPNVRRVPDSKERSYAIQLAVEQFRKNGVTIETIPYIQAPQLIKTIVNNVNHEIIIGSFYITTETAKHHLFLIGRLGVEKPVIEFSHYQKSIDLDDGKDIMNFRFVDQLDLDSDGIDEIVIELTGWEYETFEIYRYEKTAWEKVLEGGQGGC
jgi:hypothetical protein